MPTDADTVGASPANPSHLNSKRASAWYVASYHLGRSDVSDPTAAPSAKPSGRAGLQGQSSSRPGGDRHNYLGNLADMFRRRNVTHGTMSEANNNFDANAPDVRGSKIVSIASRHRLRCQRGEARAKENTLSEKHMRDSYYSMLRMGFPHTAAAIQNMHQHAYGGALDANPALLDRVQRYGCAGTLD